jgi:flagellar basal-body rod modification protein FlgD
MQVNSTSSVNSNAPTATDSTSLASQVLSQNDFLKLLVAQMTSQNPLDPMNNQDLLTQTVQFSTLQGNNELKSALASMQDSQSLLQANSLIGREVSLLVDANTTTQGVVTGVVTNSGAPQLVVNGAAYDLSQVLAISTPPANP